MASQESARTQTMCDLFYLNGGQGQNGLAALALRAHFVRLSALRASGELPTRGFSKAKINNLPRPKITQGKVLW